MRLLAPGCLETGSRLAWLSYSAQRRYLAVRGQGQSYKLRNSYVWALFQEHGRHCGISNTGGTQLEEVSLLPHGKYSWSGHKNIIEEAVAVV